MKSGFIYVVEDQTNICKIGMSINFPDKRVYQLSCKHHKDFILRGCLLTEDMINDENQIHNFFSDYRLKGEWFHINYEEIKDKSKEIGFIFQDPEWIRRLVKFIDNAYWHWDKEREIYYHPDESFYKENNSDK